MTPHRSLRCGFLLGQVGVLWDLGHTLTLFVVGGALVLFKLAMPVRIGLALELAVARMLVALGIINVARVGGSVAAGDTRPVQDGFNGSDRAPALTQVSGRPLFVGIVHGLAGSAAVALLVLSTIGTRPWRSRPRDLWRGYGRGDGAPDDRSRPSTRRRGGAAGGTRLEGATGAVVRAVPGTTLERGPPRDGDAETPSARSPD